MTSIIMQASTITVGELKARAQLAKNRRWKSLKKEEETVKKRLNLKYHTARQAFLDLLSEARAKHLNDVGAADNMGVTAVAQCVDGRKFDKVFIGIVRVSDDKTPFQKFDLVFFINRETGGIYGPKSEAAPNDRAYYGTVYQADKWDWSDTHPRPLDFEDFDKRSGVSEGAMVKKVGFYKGHEHFQPITKEELREIRAEQKQAEKEAAEV